MDFNNYNFRAHSIGRIMGGVPSPLTPEQQKTYESLLAKHRSNNKNLSYAQMKRYAFLMGKHKDPQKELTDLQKQELSELILKYESTGKNLSLNQIETLGYLHKKKRSNLCLDDTAKKFLKELVWQQITGRSQELRGRMLDKGILKEEESITLYSEVNNLLFLKNTERRSNEYFSGECDNAKGKIRDIKTSWEISTFPFYSDKITSPLYLWQLDAYMDLWDLKESELVYCLVDTPFRLIEEEINRLDRQSNILDFQADVRKDSITLVVELVMNHIYALPVLEAFCLQSSNVRLEWFEGIFKEIPESLRIKVFEHKWSEGRIRQLKEMVVLAREYMNSLLEEIDASALKLMETLKPTENEKVLENVE